VLITTGGCSVDIGPESRFLPTLPVFDAPLRGFPSEYRHKVWYAKTTMVWLTDGEKKSGDMLTRFDRIHECDRQTDTQTDTT